MDLAAALVFIASLLLSASAALLPLLGLLRPRRLWSIRLAVLSLGIGPILLSFVLTAAMTLLPGQSPAVYLCSVLGVLGLLIILNLRYIPRAALACGFLIKSLPGRAAREPIYRLGLLTAVTITITMLGLALAMPLDENDALEYAGSARQIFELKSAVDYPFLDSDKTGGYYGPWSHALGYISLQVWGFLVQGHSLEAGVIKLISPYYAMCTAFLVWVWLGGPRRAWAVWGAVVLFSTPLYYLSATANQIDSIRLFAFFAAGMCLPLAWSTQRTGALLACGAIAGCALFTHSIGLLIVPIAGLVILLKSPFPLQVALRQATLLCGAAVALVSYRLIDNVLIFGSPIADVGAVPVYGLPSLDWAGYFRESRDISTTLERLLYGVLAGLTRPNIYGMSYWLLLLATIVFLRNGLAVSSGAIARSLWTWVRTARRPVDVAALVLAIFAAMVLTSVVLGMDAFIKNVRYLLTVQPYVVMFSLAVLGPPVLRSWQLISGRFRTIFKSLIAVCFALVCIAIPSYFNYAKLRAFDLVGRQILDSDARKRSFSRAGYMVVPAYATATLPADAYILTFQQAQLAFYGRHRYLSDIDPKLMAFYGKLDLDSAHSELERLGITHLLLPGYPIPTVYNSAIDRLVADPDRVSLLYEADGNRLYQLQPRGSQHRPAAIKLVAELPFADPHGHPQWTAWDNRSRYAVDRRTDPTTGALGVQQLPLISMRRAEARLYSGRGPIDLSPGQASSPTAPVVRCGKLYRVVLDADGAGPADINVVIYPENGQPEWRTIWTGLLSARERTIHAMFDALWMPRAGEACDRAEVRIVARLYGRGSMSIRGARIESIDARSGRETWISRITALEQSWQVVPEVANQSADWGAVRRSDGTLEISLNQTDRRMLSVRSRMVPLPPDVEYVELHAHTAGRGMHDVHFVCQVANEDDVSDWLAKGVRRTLNLPQTSVLTGDGRGFAGPEPIDRHWRANARGCERVFAQIDLLRSPEHSGLPEEYARLTLIDPRLVARMRDGRTVALDTKSTVNANPRGLNQ